MLYLIGNVGFSGDTPEQNALRINNWNKTVRAEDMVIHVGNFSDGKADYYQLALNGLIVFVTGSEYNVEGNKGVKFKNLFLYSDGTFTLRNNPKRNAVFVVSTLAKNLTSSKIPEIVSDASAEWSRKRPGQHMRGAHYSYLLDKSVVNIDCSLWGEAPVSFNSLLMGSING